MIQYTLILILACCSPVAVAAFVFSSSSLVVLPPLPVCSSRSKSILRNTQRPFSLRLKSQMATQISSSAGGGGSRKGMSESSERAAVKRFTVGYDKLCKNCPTRLQPRKDTLVGMILGLPVEERAELLAEVQQRLALEETTAMEKGEETSDCLRTPMEVYQFQLDGSDVAPEKLAVNGDSEKERGIGDGKRTMRVNREKERDRKRNDALVGEKELRGVSRRMEKARAKLTRSEMKLTRATHLLDVTSKLLQKGNGGDGGALALLDIDGEDDEEIDELRTMSRQQLKLQRLKYMAVMSKCERTRAKCRVKRYAASLDLARIKAQMVEQAV